MQNLPKRKLIPYGTKVLIIRDKAITETESGIVLPGAEKEKLNRGTIIAVGSQCKEAKAGCEVIFDMYGGSELSQDGVDYTAIEEDRIITFLA